MPRLVCEHCWQPDQFVEWLAKAAGRSRQAGGSRRPPPRLGSRFPITLAFPAARRQQLDTESVGNHPGTASGRDRRGSSVCHCWPS
jgi:hypothetical protein